MANIKIMDTKAVVQFDCLGTPTHYRIGETSDFSDSTWTEFDNPELIIEYNLPTIKTYNLFAQVKNSVMESNIKSIVVDRLDDYITINLKVIILDGGNSQTNTNNIPVILQYDGTPIQYKYALNPVLVNNLVEWSDYTWNDYTSFPSSFYIGGSDGIKNLYFLLKDSRDATSELNNIITYYSPVAPTITGAEFISPSTSSHITVTPSYTGIVTEYSCEKVGQPLVWKVFTGSTFELILDSEGIVNYSIVLKNSFGQSSAYSIAIDYAPPTFGLDSILINSGDTETSDTTLSINFNKIGTDDITYYRIGTNSDLSAVDWIAYTGSPVNYIINRPESSVGLVIYAQLKSINNIESEVKSDTIYFIVNDSIIVNIMGSLGGGINKLYEGKYYSYNRMQYENQFDLYNFNSGDKLTDWKIMNDAETILEFGTSGAGPGNQTANIYPVDHPYYNTVMFYGGNYDTGLYLGLYVPNGNYKLSFLISTTDDVGLINGDGRLLSINGKTPILPAIPIQHNTTFVDLGTFSIVDGKLKLMFKVLNYNMFGFSDLIIEKIS